MLARGLGWPEEHSRPGAPLQADAPSACSRPRWTWSTCRLQRPSSAACCFSATGMARGQGRHAGTRRGSRGQVGRTRGMELPSQMCERRVFDPAASNRFPHRSDGPHTHTEFGQPASPIAPRNEPLGES
eukprot:365299-Chlamydomonas_euryale.AAC.12